MGDWRYKHLVILTAKFPQKILDFYKMVFIKNILKDYQDYIWDHIGDDYFLCFACVRRTRKYGEMNYNLYKYTNPSF